jgi:hypothetical protein
MLNTDPDAKVLSKLQEKRMVITTVCDTSTKHILAVTMYIQCFTINACFRICAINCIINTAVEKNYVKVSVLYVT